MEAIGKAFQVHSDAAEDHEFRKKLASVRQHSAKATFLFLPFLILRFFVILPIQFLSLLGQKHLKIADNTIPPFYDM